MKATDYNKLADSDLLEKIKEEKAALAKMKFSHTVAGTENPMQLRMKRKEVARMLTVMNQRKNNGK
ncbi:MAG: 50S ribosomal protein L29 [Flavobacteriales bacterium]